MRASKSAKWRRWRYRSDHDFNTDTQAAKLIEPIKPPAKAALIEPHDFNIVIILLPFSSIAQ